MNRGVLKLTNTEAKELIGNIDLTKYSDTPLGNKLDSVNLDNPEVEIFLSQDELETILDEIGFVDENTNQNLSGVLNKINRLMGIFRE